MGRLYRSRSIKRSRRSNAEIEALKEAIYAKLEAEQPMTVRHLFYRLVSDSVIEKTEAAYKGVLVRLLGKMRRRGEIPFEWLIDSSRWMRKPTTYNNVLELLNECRETYRRALWRDQNVYVEVWTEKDAIASILYEATEKWDVPLMVCKGFASLSFIHSAATEIRHIGKPTHILFFGDFDPSGLSILQTLERDLREFSGDADITFTRLAVTESQIQELNLPTRPTKRTDSRAKNFKGESVEVDAISTNVLRWLCSHAITQLIEPKALRAALAAEESERESLRIFLDAFDGAL